MFDVSGDAIVEQGVSNPLVCGFFNEVVSEGFPFSTRQGSVAMRTVFVL